MTADVFLSYAHRSNLERARDLEAALTTVGVTVFRDETGIPAGSPFPAEIADALLAARVVVLFVDAAFFESDYCRWELEAALAPIQEPWDQTAGHVVVARSVEEGIPDPLGRLPPVVRTRQWPRAGDTAALAALVRQALTGCKSSLADLGGPASSELRSRLLASSRLPPPVLPGEEPRYPAILPPSLGESFLGRSETLWQIDYYLRSGAAGAGPAGGRALAITGIGGNGKTRLALEYVHRYGQHFAGGVFWVDAEVTDERLEEQFYGILTKVLPDTRPLADLRREGSDLGAAVADAIVSVPDHEQVLFVVDNVPEPVPGVPARQLSHWCPLVGRTSLLATSRVMVIEQGVRDTVLGELPAAAAVAMLTSQTDANLLAEPDWAAIADWLGRLPLCLVLVNAALRLGGLSATSLLDLSLAQSSATAELDRQMEAIRDAVPQGALRGVTEAFGLSYSRLSEPARGLAGLLAHLGPDPIPEVLVAGLGESDAPPSARAELISRSFISQVRGEPVRFFGRMHRILRDFVKAQSSEPEAVLLKLVEVLTAALDWRDLEDPRAWPRVNTVVPHGLEVLAAMRTLPSRQSAWASAALAGRIGQTLLSQGRPQDACRLLQASHDTYCELFEPRSPDVLASGANLANALVDLGEYDAAEVLQRELLTAMTEEYGAEEVRTLKMLGNLGNSLRGLHNLGEARAIQERVVEARSRVLGSDDRETLMGRLSLAAIVMEQGHLEWARLSEVSLLADCERALGARIW